MKKIDNFVICSVVKNIVEMDDEQIYCLAELLIDYPQKAERVSNSINFAFMDRQLTAVEVQEPAC